MNLCKYKNIFGMPRKGAHSYRIFDIAIVDLFATIIVAYIISKYYKYNFYKVLALLIMIGIISHKIFCVDTKLNQILFNE